MRTFWLLRTESVTPVISPKAWAYSQGKENGHNNVRHGEEKKIYTTQYILVIFSTKMKAIALLAALKQMLLYLQ